MTDDSLKVVVFGATGNLGTSVVRSLMADPAVSEIVAVARRRPEIALSKVTWCPADITRDPLDDLVRGADVVVHLAWAIQPSHDERYLHRVNVMGSGRIFASVVRCGVPAVVYASSVGTYAAATNPTDRVSESWPASGVETSQYSRHKAGVEYILDHVEREHPEMRIVRLRPALVFQERAASEIKRLFLGPFAPIRYLGRRGVPLVPDDPRLSFQVVHADDVADAFRAAVVGSARGAFNLAAEPVVTPHVLAELLDARPSHRLSPRTLRFLASIAYRLRLQPTEPGWIDLATWAPLMSTDAAREVLGWSPRHSSIGTIRELLEGFSTATGTNSPPLVPVRRGRLVPLAGK